MSDNQDTIIPAAQAADSILKSYNVFNPNVSTSPEEALNNTQDFRNEKWNVSHVARTPLTKFTGVYRESKSAESSSENYSNAVGIKGSYGFFSASAKYSSSKVTTKTSASFHSSMNCIVRQGTIGITNLDGITDLLNESLVKQLKNISSLGEAQEFTKKYGTHLITSINLGGLLSITTDIESGTYSNVEKASVEISAAYNAGAASISATAEAASAISNSSSYGKVTQIIQTIGGNTNIAGRINSKDAQTILAWSDSCSSETVCGINDSIEYYKLIDKLPASKILEKYINLVILAQSIQSPTIFSSIIGTTPYIVNTATATVSEGFKIISGGFHVQENSSSYIIGSYPQLDNEKMITGWSSLSHDLSYPSASSETLTSFAIAVYDPMDLLRVAVSESGTDNTDWGYSRGRSKVADGFNLTGGGCLFISQNPSNKYITSSYPEDSSWITTMRDYNVEAHKCEITTYAVGIALTEELKQMVKIHPRSIHVSAPTAASHGNVKVTLNDNIRIAGGGVRLSDITVGKGNFVQQSFPSTNNQWSETNRDMDSVTPVTATAYALNLVLESDVLDFRSKLKSASVNEETV